MYYQLACRSVESFSLHKYKVYVMASTGREKPRTHTLWHYEVINYNFFPKGYLAMTNCILVPS